MLEPDNLLFANKILHPESAVLELGCGISGVMALALAPSICSYICTDQQYVLKQLRQNIAENVETASRRGQKGSRKVKKGREVGSKPSPSTQSIVSGSIQVLELDWETTSLETLSTALGPAGGHLDMVIACDCIYNSHLVEPLTQTCVEICRSRTESPVVCLVAQQLRSEEVFQEWLHAFLREFTVWRIPDKVLSSALRASEGYVLHLGVLRSSNIHT
jgi:predicted nicotinamide N-methyase